MKQSEFSAGTGMGYVLDQRIRFEAADEFLDYLYDQEQEKREELLSQCIEDKKFLAWLRSYGIEVPVEQWENDSGSMKERSGIYVDILRLLEQAAPSKKRRILNLCSRFLKEQPEYWLIQHLDLYSQINSDGGELLTQKDKFLEGGGSGVEDFKELMNRMTHWMDSVREHMLNNYILYEKGFFRRERYGLAARHIDGYFVDDGTGKKVPVGYLKERKRIQDKHCLSRGIEAQVHEAQKEISAVRSRLSQGTKRLEALQTEIKDTYKKPGRIRSVIGMAAGAAGTIYGIFMLVNGAFAGTAGKIGMVAVMAAAGMTFLTGLRGFGRCNRWKQLVLAIREMKKLDEQVAFEEEQLETERALWEQKGVLTIRSGFPMERDKEILERIETLEPGLRKRTRPFLWTLALGAVLAAAGLFSDTQTPAEINIKRNELHVLSSEQVDWKQLEQVSVWAEAESSLVSEKTGMIYGPELMLDGDINTSWQEGEDGWGEEETLTFSFYGEEVPLKVISFYGGSFQSEEKFTENGRPAEITVICSLDGEEKGRFSAELEDAMMPNYLQFDQAVSCNAVNIQIDSVYPGSRYQDTAVTEMAFYKEK